ncbi:MAG: methyltransferase domain-containing protein [Leptospirales bacterium]|nr:methyltransferase domain-containing protein [Leptospirales bacterium]
MEKRVNPLKIVDDRVVYSILLSMRLIYKSLFVAFLVGLAVPGCGRVKERLYSPGDREAWQKPGQVLDILGVQIGNRIADVGAGAGYFTFKLAERVGDPGRVYAVEVDRDMLEILQEKKELLKRGNVEVIAGDQVGAALPSDLDLIFSCNVFHEMENPEAYFRKLQPLLKRTGRVAIIEVDPKGAAGLGGIHGTKSEEIVEIMKRAGYTLTANHHDLLEEQHFLVFEKTGL